MTHSLGPPAQGHTPRSTRLRRQERCHYSGTTPHPSCRYHNACCCLQTIPNLGVRHTRPCDALQIRTATTRFCHDAAAPWQKRFGHDQLGRQARSRTPPAPTAGDQCWTIPHAGLTRTMLVQECLRDSDIRRGPQARHCLLVLAPFNPGQPPSPLPDALQMLLAGQVVRGSISIT